LCPDTTGTAPACQNNVEMSCQFTPDTVVPTFQRADLILSGTIVPTNLFDATSSMGKFNTDLATANAAMKQLVLRMDSAAEEIMKDSASDILDAREELIDATKTMGDVFEALEDACEEIGPDMTALATNGRTILNSLTRARDGITEILRGNAQAAENAQNPNRRKRAATKWSTDTRNTTRALVVANKMNTAPLFQTIGEINPSPPIRDSPELELEPSMDVNIESSREGKFIRLVSVFTATYRVTSTVFTGTQTMSVLCIPGGITEC